ncbi:MULTISPECIES: class IV adenylate cyclase [Tissierellales]|jgi:adenylate cyclase class 2|uniref:CYTH domain-containing protein n=1 Tax=Acidilutibacter cellobiosedens TaxID=2507161 RepID=A0A410QB61_9FIRM|nr:MULTISPECIES: class IV adenylate cyclase [Tissierellales]MBE6081935.1 CYTH domain-containing protein [Tissierellaceae bacterium]QAT61262.1 CYTH domain-containing protein [Acidilutibacter cellobiosedens]SCL96234.1 putative adenylyl cyclase CyaB [Sporanaerobacter sp. PP17-6a]
MSKELEVKILDIDSKKMEEKLKNIGAKLIKKEYQINIIIDGKDNYIQQKLNSYLRIRETQDLMSNKVKDTFTLKQNISKDGIRENIETDVDIDNKEKLIYILKTLGLNVIHEGKKKRISYMYGKVRFDIDTWDKDTYPYPYMEIEVEKKEDLKKILELLGIDRNKISTKSIAELREDLRINL